MVKVLPGRERTSPHELVQISGEQLICGTELAYKFSFSAHPSVLYILRVHCVVIRTNEVSFVDHKQTSFIHYYIIYSLTYPRAGSVVTRSCALFERIRGRPYCLQGGHGSLKFTGLVLASSLVQFLCGKSVCFVF